MCHLEPVYLANVILHINNIETIIKLIQVNKGCREATKIIRYYQTRKLYESDENVDMNYVVIKNVFDLFPNIETINFKEGYVLNDLKLFEKVKCIELGKVYRQKKIPQQIKEKLIQLGIYSFSLDGIKLNQFPNVKKVKINYSKEGHLKDLLGNNQIELKQLIIETADKKELDCLKEYKNIESKIIKLNTKITRERYYQLKESATVYSNVPIDGIDIKKTLYLSYKNVMSNDIKDAFFVHYKNVIPNQFDINRLNDLTLFTSCELESDCDLRNCELLEEIITVFTCIDNLTIQIKGLNHLKRIQDIKTVDFIPSSVTYLSFNPVIFNYQQLLKKDINCFNNLKEVKINVPKNKKVGDPKILMNFISCTKIEVFHYDISNQSFEIPINVKHFDIHFCDNKNQINEIKKIMKLKNLSIDFDFYKDKQQTQGMYDSLTELEWLKTNYIDGITLPSSLTYLELDLYDETDLSNYTNLKEIHFRCLSSDVINLKLPNKLNKLHIEGKVVVTNSDEIEIERIILYNSPSQHSKWKSKNIFVQSKYKPEENRKRGVEGWML